MATMRLWQHKNGYFYYIHNGQMVSLRTNDPAFAKKMFKQIQEEHKAGLLHEITKAETRTFSEFVDDYRQARAGLAKATQNADRLALNHFADYYGDKPMFGITKALLDKYRGAIRAKYPNTHTCNDYLRALKTAFETALDWGYLRGINLKKFKQYKLDQAKPVYMTAEEVSRLIKASQDDPDMKYAIPVMCYCAISRSEIMTPIHVSETEIQYTRVKTKKLVKIPISDELRGYIAPLGTGIHRLVPWKHPRTLSRRFEGLCKKAELKGISPHKVRHTFANLALRAGVPIEVISEYLGHSSIEITIRFYADMGYISKPEYVNKISFTIKKDN